jgi:protein-S-isoprenylcysteine O-methyltransferase Ste14
LEDGMSLFVRALTYSALFVGVVLAFVPRQLLAAGPLARPAGGWIEAAGIAAVALGAALALWCIVTFAVTGRGTPAPFDAPRRLVTRGPYRWVRNPMYAGAILALTGAALMYQSWLLAGYALVFAASCHLFVVWYEEPALRRTFAGAYDAYCRQARRWRPGPPRGG